MTPEVLTEPGLPALPGELAALEAEGLRRIHEAERAEAEREAQRVAREAAEAEGHWQGLLAAVRGDLPEALLPFTDDCPPKGWSRGATWHQVVVRLPGRAPILVRYHHGERTGWGREQPPKWQVLSARLWVRTDCDPESGPDDPEVGWTDKPLHATEDLSHALALAALEGRRHLQLAAEESAPPVAAEDDIPF